MTTITPQDREEALQWQIKNIGADADGAQFITDSFAALLATVRERAVAGENEACSLLADDMALYTGVDVALAIRERLL